MTLTYDEISLLFNLFLVIGIKLFYLICDIQLYDFLTLPTLTMFYRKTSGQSLWKGTATPSKSLVFQTA